MTAGRSEVEIRERFLEAIEERILVLDGAMGTAIQALDLGPEDFGGDSLAGCNEVLVRTCPDRIREIHRGYLHAGADCIETNTFGGTPFVLGEYDLAEAAEELNEIAAALARDEVDSFAGDGGARFVLGSMGPTTKTLTVTGGITFDEMREQFRAQARGLIRGGADILILETVQDTLNLKAGHLGILGAFEDLGVRLPVALCCTIEPTGTMLAGQGVEAFYASVEHIKPLFVGMNCATGPRFLTDHLRPLAE
ncbi:MAG: homocysteine S-methyltransferase family protein, partial [Planctomycetota bacterium]